MSSNNFIQRSVLGALAFFREAFFSEEIALRGGFLQSLDPRIKTISFLLFMLQILFTQSILVLIQLYGLCLLLAVFSKINLWFFLKRTWIFIPLFSLLIVLPALFNNLTPGEPLVSFTIFKTQLVISRQGALSAQIFIGRVITAVSLAALLSITTRHFVLLRVLRIFKLPQIFVMVLGICYRYIYFFMGLVQDTYLAIKSRVGGRIEYRRGQQVVAWNLAALWNRSRRLNEEVYQAMLARGYQGEALTWQELKIRARDWFWFLIGLIIIWLIQFLN